MKYPTKQKRLFALMDAYMKLVERPVTTEEVVVWSLSCGLLPCPKRGDPLESCEAWERRLEEAQKGN